MRSRLQWLALTGLLMAGAVSADAQPPVRNVLLLQSFPRGHMALDYFTGVFRLELDKQSGRPVNVTQIVVDQTGFAGAPEQAVVDYIGATYAQRAAPDLMVTVAAPAAVFARQHRAQLFPKAPLLLAAVDQRFLRDAPLGENETAVATVNDFPRLFDDILRLLPETRQLFIVMGSGQIGRIWRRELDEETKRFQERLTFLWSDGLSLPEILRRCSSLPDNSAILYVTFGTDAQGWAYADDRILADLHASANAPLFAIQSVMLGTGIVGGALMSIDELGQKAADAASRILDGAPPRSIAVPLQSPGQPTFDWRELKRWGIPESRLPSGSIVRFRGPSLWSEYKFTVLSALGALIVQSLLIVGLLYQHRARQRAEIESRRNLALAADANRRQTMSALTSSIAHELGQPLSSMIHNTQALELMLAADRATPETMREILFDIRSQGIQATQIIDRHRTMLRSREVDRKPIDLHAVISESLALVAHDLRARQIQTTVDLSPNECIVDGDQVLLQQVLVNLVINAIDAMAESPGARQLTVTTSVTAGDVELSVRDTGTGLPAQFDDTLFAPFVTTKPHGIGIGLTIVRTIVIAHRGSMTARNNPDGGATFTVTLRRSDATLSDRKGAA